MRVLARLLGYLGGMDKNPLDVEIDEQDSQWVADPYHPPKTGSWPHLAVALILVVSALTFQLVGHYTDVEGPWAGVVLFRLSFTALTVCAVLGAIFCFRQWKA